LKLRGPLAVLALLLLSTACSVGSSKPQASPGQTYATVNGVKITETQVNQRRHLIAFLSPSNASQLKGHTAVVQITDELVDESLVAQAATKAKTKVPPTAVSNEENLLTQEVSSLYPTSKQVQAAMKSNSVTQADLNAYAKLSALLQAYLQKVVKTPTVPVSEIKSYYTANQSQFKLPAQYDVRHILVKTQSLAETIDKEVKADPSKFASLAKKYSIDTASAKNGGDLGYAPLTNYVAAFADAVKKLQVHQISPVVHSQYGYHVIELMGVKPASTEPLSQVSSEIQSYLSQQNQQQAIQAYVQKLRTKGKVTVQVPKNAT